MLSYQHGFHAGNFADVLKHLVSAQILLYLTEKDKPFFYLDTHSGSGGYKLNTEQAQKTVEYTNGIGKLWAFQNQNELPDSLKTYLQLIHNFQSASGIGGTELNAYPGSPWFAQHILRQQDRASLFELHPTEFKNLIANTRHHRGECKRIKLFQEDGFQACLSQLPPKERRGFILMDPPYEVKTDYDKAVKTLINAYKKFATGTYALWYPVVDRNRINRMEKQFIESGIQNIQLFEFGIDADSTKGMQSAGMIVINPPWTLMQQMKLTLPWLKQHLAPENGHFRQLQLVDE